MIGLARRRPQRRPKKRKQEPSVKTYEITHEGKKVLVIEKEAQPILLREKRKIGVERINEVVELSQDAQALSEREGRLQRVDRSREGVVEKFSRAADSLNLEEIQKKVNSIRTMIAGMEMRKKYGVAMEGKKEPLLLHLIKMPLKIPYAIATLIPGFIAGGPKEALARKRYFGVAKPGKKEIEAIDREIENWKIMLNVYERELKIAEAMHKARKFVGKVPDEIFKEAAENLPRELLKFTEAEKEFIKNFKTALEQEAKATSPEHIEIAERFYQRANAYRNILNQQYGRIAVIISNLLRAIQTQGASA